MNNINHIKSYIQSLIDLLSTVFDTNHLFQLAIISGVIILSLITSFLINKKLKLQKHLQFYMRKYTLPIVFLVAMNIAMLTILRNDHYAKIILFYIDVIVVSYIIINTIQIFVQKILHEKAYCKTLARIIKYSLWAVIIIKITDKHNDIITMLDNISLHIGKSTDISVWDVIRGVILVVLAIVLSTLCNNFIEKKVNSINSLDSNLRQIIIRISKISIFILSLTIILPLIGIDITALSVLGGAIGVGIGFGLQKISSNFLSGFIILMDRSIKVGDRLIIDNNTGIITKITMRYVVMQRSDGTELLIPNETFITTNIQNQSYSNTEIRSEIICNISSKKDIANSIDVITNAINSSSNVITQKTSVTIHKFIDSGVELKCHFWLSDANLINKTNNYIYIKLIELFNNKQITPPETSQKIEIIKVISQ